MQVLQQTQPSSFRHRTVTFHTIDDVFQSIHICHNCGETVKDEQTTPFVKLTAGYFWCSERCFKQQIKVKPQQETLL